MALIFLGISGGTTLVHTDDVGQLLRFHAGASAISHGVGVASDTCVACQWENSLFSPQVPAVPLSLPAFASLPVLSESAQTRSPHPFDHTAPRAPPRVS